MQLDSLPGPLKGQVSPEPLTLTVRPESLSANLTERSRCQIGPETLIVVETIPKRPDTSLNDPEASPSVPETFKPLTTCFF